MNFARERKQMGQALRRAASRARTPDIPTKTPPHLKNSGPKSPAADVSDLGGLSREGNAASVIEERDASYDQMLNKMVGRITSKRGGKLEMGEAFIVEKYNRPMPKERSKVKVNDEEKVNASVGTLEAPQLRQILLLHEGKSEDHNGPMSVESIAERFKLDPAQVKNIIRFVSLPKEEKVNGKSESSRTDI